MRQNTLSTIMTYAGWRGRDSDAQLGSGAQSYDTEASGEAVLYRRSG